ncbi:alpha/beta fold hydrolase [Kitasatospora sp. NPDC127067]|uniref:alpha/beta fold hydrolase n=1 Tax=Kitasatospora sp. NPDC127067 TaxID=3347126 RepID=UPI00365D49BB
MSDLPSSPRTRTRGLRRAALTLLAITLVGLAPGTASASPKSAPPSLAPAASALSLQTESTPPGSNNFDCRPTAAHPRPVVLVHGTMSTMGSWGMFSQALADEGPCVFALNCGGEPDGPVQGYGDMPTGAGQLAAFLDRVLAATGAPEADIVAHSQGGLLARYVIQSPGGAPKIHELVGLAPPNHGTTMSGLAALVAEIPGDVDAVACTLVPPLFGG